MVSRGFKAVIKKKITLHFIHSTQVLLKYPENLITVKIRIKKGGRRGWRETQRGRERGNEGVGTGMQFCRCVCGVCRCARLLLIIPSAICQCFFFAGLLKRHLTGSKRLKKEKRAARKWDRDEGWRRHVPDVSTSAHGLNLQSSVIFIMSTKPISHSKEQVW